MELLSIFNNGSRLWILFLMMIAWAGYWGYKTYKSHKSGYHKQNPDGSYTDLKPSLKSNGNFIMLVGGLIVMTVMMIFINGDYR